MRNRYTDASPRLQRISPDWLIAILFFLAAAALRIWGIWSSLPYVDHVDEPNLVAPAVAMVKTGDLNPHWFLYPALVIYIEAAIVKLNVLWGTWLGYYTGPESIPDSHFGLTLAPDVILWGRTFIALTGAVSVAGTYALGRSMFGRGAGLIAGLLLLTSPLHILLSHHITCDLMMSAMGLATLAASWRLSNRPRLGTALLAGAFVGLTAGSKYNGLIVASVAGIAWLLALPVWVREQRERRARKGLGASLSWVVVGIAMVVATGAAFLLANPFVVLDWQHWRPSMDFQVGQYVPATEFGQMVDSFVVKLRTLWEGERMIVIGGLLGACVLLTELLFRLHRSLQFLRAVLLVLPFPLIYLAAMSRFTVNYERNLAITLPFICLAAGGGLARLIEVLAARLPATAPATLRNPAAPTLLAAVVGLALTSPPGKDMLDLAAYLAGPDSRNLAYDWIRIELQAGNRIATELTTWHYCAPPPYPCSLPDVYAPNAQLTDRPPSWYAERGYTYVVLAGRDKSLLFDERAEKSQGQADTIAEYRELPQVREFLGNREGGKGPYIVALRVGDGLSEIERIERSGARFGDLAELWGYAYAPLPNVDGYYDPLEGKSDGAQSFRPGEAVGLNLYWRALKSGAGTSGEWLVKVLITDSAGGVVAQLDRPPVSNWRVRPVREWYQNEFLFGVYNLPLPPNVPPGTYHITVKLVDPQSGTALPVATTGSQPATELKIGSIRVQPPSGSTRPPAQTGGPAASRARGPGRME